MNREFLYELLETASVSGFEEEIQRKVIKYARGFADEVYTDEIADVVSIVNPDAKIKVMLSAHMDEIGLMVSHITEKGMLHVSKAGGIYPGTYLGQKVRIMHEGNVVYGAVRNHGSLNKKELEITDIIIDIGAVSREDAMAHVACGDPVSFDTDYRELLNDRLCARGLDDRLGGYIILEAAKKAKERGCTCGIYAATTVGEELTKHGAAWCASRITPTLAIVLDVTYTSDYEGTRAIEKYHHNRHLDRQIDKCISQGFPKYRILAHGHVIINATKQIISTFKIIKTQCQGFNYRIYHEYSKQKYHWQQKYVRCCFFVYKTPSSFIVSFHLFPSFLTFFCIARPALPAIPSRFRKSSR